MSCLSSLMLQIPYNTRFERHIVKDTLGHEWSVCHVKSPLSTDWRVHLQCTSNTLSPDIAIGTVLLMPEMQNVFRHLRFTWENSKFVSDRQKSLSSPHTNESTCLYAISFYKKEIIPDSTPDREKPKETVFQITNQLSEDMLVLFRKEYFTDVSLKCGSKLFRAHRGILAARSPVFSSMFHSKMRESQEDSVDIGDIDPEILLAVLKYLYSGQTTLESASNACALLSASEMYQLDGLKEACVDFLTSSVDIDNVLRILVVSDLYGVKSLKSYVVSYICENFNSLESTPEWLALKEEKPSLIFEVMSEKIKSLKTNVDKVNLSLDPGTLNGASSSNVCPKELIPPSSSNFKISTSRPTSNFPFGRHFQEILTGSKTSYASLKKQVPPTSALNGENYCIPIGKSIQVAKHAVIEDNSLNEKKPSTAELKFLQYLQAHGTRTNPATNYKVFSERAKQLEAGKPGNFIPCEFCGKMILMDSLEIALHETSCRPDLVSLNLTK